jgi:uncharacterized glyoxalase superfamily protein PhnB
MRHSFFGFNVCNAAARRLNSILGQTLKACPNIVCSSIKRKAMSLRVVPMIHVPDVRATVDWYKGIGFTVIDTYDDGGEGLSFAILSFGHSEVMFNSGGQPSARDRREVDLYVYSEDVDHLYERLKDRVEVVKAPHDTFYGMREFIIRDLNRFWMTFGQESSAR